MPAQKAIAKVYKDKLLLISIKVCPRRDVSLLPARGSGNDLSPLGREFMPFGIGEALCSTSQAPDTTVDPWTSLLCAAVATRILPSLHARFLRASCRGRPTKPDPCPPEP